MKHKINGAGIAVTGFLIFLLLFIIAVLWSLNVSGPARAYEAKIAAQIEAIHKEHDAIENIERDVFRYVTYIGEDQEMYYWLNEEAQVITTREKKTRDDDAVLSAAAKLGYESASIRLGYGYDNPVYVVNTGGKILLFDYDSYEFIYEREVMNDE